MAMFYVLYFVKFVFCFRSEINMLTAPGKAWVTGKIQQELVRI